MALVFGLQTLCLIDISKIYHLKGPKPKNEDHTNFYECCDLTKKVYLMYIHIMWKSFNILADFNFKRFRHGYDNISWWKLLVSPMGHFQIINRCTMGTEFRLLLPLFAFIPISSNHKRRKREGRNFKCLL